MREGMQMSIADGAQTSAAGTILDRLAEHARERVRAARTQRTFFRNLSLDIVSWTPH